MTDTFRALCTELVEAWDATADFDFNDFGHAAADIVTCARAALAQPAPVAPTDEEIMEVFWEHQNGMEELCADDWPAAARAVLARWGDQ